VDGIGVGHFDPSRRDYQIAWVAGEEGFFIVGQDGQTIANQHTGHAQKMSIGHFLPERPGVQIATITYWASQGVFSVYDGRGGKLHESEPWHLASAIVPVGWRGDGSDLLLLSAHPVYGGMLDGRGRRVVMFPEGFPSLACDAVDVDGCGREEILSWDFDRFVIFKAAGRPPGKIPPRYTGPLYNRSNYKANVALPAEVIGRRHMRKA
jgi:rhamnogalacturonan endolyase